MGIIPEEISYDIKLSEVTFSYPSRPDITVSCVCACVRACVRACVCVHITV